MEYFTTKPKEVTFFPLLMGITDNCIIFNVIGLIYKVGFSNFLIG